MSIMYKDYRLFPDFNNVVYTLDNNLVLYPINYIEAMFILIYSLTAIQQLV